MKRGRWRGRRLRLLGALVAAAVSACSGASSGAGASAHTRGIRLVARVHVGGQPCGVAGVGDTVWVSDAQRARLLQIDAASNTVRTVAKLDPTPCEIATGFGSLWVVTQSGRLDRVDTVTGHVIARIRVGAASYEAVATSDAMWVSNRNGGTIQRIDPHTDRVVQTLHLDGNPGGIAATPDALWVGDDTDGSTRLFRVDLTDGKVSRVTAGERPGYVAVSAGRIWVSNVQDGTVSWIDPSSSRLLGTVHVGISPVNLTGVAGPSPEVWVPDDAGNQVVRIDALTGRVLGRMSVGGGPAVASPVGKGQTPGEDVWVSLFAGAAVVHLAAE